MDKVNNFTCVCPAGFTGVKCEENIDECLSSSCVNGMSTFRTKIKHIYVKLYLCSRFTSLGLCTQGGAEKNARQLYIDDISFI